MERFPLIGTESRFPETYGQNAARTVGKYAGIVPKGNGIPRVSKKERRQASTQRNLYRTGLIGNFVS